MAPGSGSTTFSNIQSFIFSDFGDYIVGTAGVDHYLGERGADFLFGGQGDDYLDGGNGSDELRSGQGDDFAEGGAGNDIIYGGMFDDLVSGGDHDDILRGGIGNDVLHGGNGDDIINGGNALNTLYGEAGSDTFTFVNLSSRNTVMDFTVGVGGDRINLHDLLLTATNFQAGDNLTTAWNQYFRFVDGGNSSSTLQINVDAAHAAALQVNEGWGHVADFQGAANLTIANLIQSNQLVDITAGTGYFPLPF